jgi:peptidoglycan/LPS O-acetylase OafA/YrhL
MRQKFAALNGLRMFAALLVVLFHYANLAASFTSLPHFAQNLITNGTIALPFFYVLSGFVLAHSYTNRAVGRGDFYSARIARLYPVYLLSFLLFLPIAVEKYLRHPATGLHNGPQTYVFGSVLTLFAVQAWTPLSQAWNGPAWSLSVEAFFYLMFPFVLPRIAKMRPAPLVALLGTFWLAMISLTVAHEQNVIRPELWNRYIMYQPIFWMPTFLVGVATYRLARHWREVSGALATVISAASVAVLLLLAGLLTPTLGGDFLVNGGAAPLIAIIVLAFSHPRCFSSRVMGWWLFDFLGGASYIIYILQSPSWHIFRAVTDALRHVHGLSVVQDWQFISYLVFIFAFALIVQQVIERPAQRYLSTRRVGMTELQQAQPARVVAA